MLKITKAVWEQLRQHGEETYPNECCGALLGNIEDDIRTVAEAIRCGNTRTDSPQNRYNISPQELIAVQRHSREAGVDIIGFYHSHPDHPPQWSVTDLAEAHWLGCSYVITSVESGNATRTNSFVLRGRVEEDKSFEDERIEVAKAQEF